MDAVRPALPGFAPTHCNPARDKQFQTSSQDVRESRWFLACGGVATAMAEPRNQGGGSSLQRKKPPWLRLDIPAAQVSQDEPPTFVQSVRRQGFLRSISMPVESTVHFHSPASDPHDARDRRRQAFQRQTSITQTIKSSKKVHFERISTVPIKGSRAARRVSRRGRSLSKLFLRYHR
ncbi:hypothetical protein Z043_118833, partial [Scleropages formosus]